MPPPMCVPCCDISFLIPIKDLPPASGETEPNFGRALHALANGIGSVTTALDKPQTRREGTT